MSECVTACCTGRPIAGGLSGTDKLTGKYLYPVFVPLVGSTGALNKIAEGATLDSTYITGKFNETEKEDRWYPFPRITSLAFAETTDDKEDLDGIQFNTGSETKGQITYVHAAKSGQSFLKNAYKSTMDCSGEMGVFWVTNFGHVVGVNGGDGALYPIPLEQDTLSAQLMESTDGATQKIIVGMQYSETVNEGCFDYIDKCNIEYSALKWFALAPRQVVFREVSNAAQTTITARFNYINSGFGSKAPVNGLLAADLSYDDGTTTATVYNVTDSASVAVTSLVQDAVEQDKYVITMAAAQTASDVIKIDLVKDGLNMASAEVTLD